MILADKITEERKKNGWSQEELADQLGVSRQAVSKWESAGTIPDLQKIIQLANLFGVSTDYLLKEEMEPEDRYMAMNPDQESKMPPRRVLIEEANAFLDVKKEAAPVIANAVTLCILSPVLVMLLSVFSEEKMFDITEGIATGIGCTALFIMIAVAVFLFITYGMKMSNYEYLEKEMFETEYGVTGMVKEKKHAYEQTFSMGIAVGVVLCILSVIPTIIAGAAEASGPICAICVAGLLILVAIGVNIIIRVGMIKSSFDTLLQEGEFSMKEKKAKGKLQTLSGAYWCLATAIYLAWSFWTIRWDMTWIIWPVAGVLFAAFSGIVRVIMRVDE